MNTLTKVLTTLALTVTVAGAANAAKLVASDNYVTTDLCIKAAKGSKIVLLKAIKSSGLSKSFVVNNVKCNDSHITYFVAKHGNKPEAMNDMLNQYLKAGKVSISDIASL